MKILFLAPDPPVPPSGGGVRSFFILKELLSRGSVDLFVLRSISLQQTDTLKSMGVTEISVASKSECNNLNKGNFQLILKYILPILFSKEELSEELASYARYRNSYFPKLLRPYIFFWLILWSKIKKVLPSATTYRYEPFKKLESLINKKLLNYDYDLIFLDYSYIYPLIEHLLPNSVKLVTNAHNIEYKILEQYASGKNHSLLGKYFNFEKNLMKKHELRGFFKSDKILCCSKSDKELLVEKGITEKNVIVIPNGVDTSYFQPAPLLTKEPSILFTGSFGYEPNVDAMRWFINMVLPQLHQKSPNLNLIIAGRGAKVLNEEFGALNNIEIINSPEDMRPLFNKAWICIVPLRIGSGTRLKILEAWAMEKAVVSTEKGVEGIDYKNHENVLIANTENDLTSIICDLIENGELRRAVAFRGRAKVEQTYDWSIVLENLILV